MNLNLKAEDQHTYDAIVIGSGISGGWAAKELTEKGLRVLLLERGKDVKHIEDYTTANTQIWEFPHRGRLTLGQKEGRPVQTREGSYPYNEQNGNFWADDLANPYIEEKRFDWYRGYQVGGKSLTWGRQCYRWSDLDFEANIKEGIGTDWPIRYKDLVPWYEYVEKFVGISGAIEGLDVLPDSIFLPPMEMNCVEKEVKQRIEKSFAGRKMIMGRAAHLTQPGKIQLDLGRSQCQYRNQCSRGCVYGGYFSTNAATLPAAMKTGKLTLRPFSIVHSIIYDDKLGKAKGVRIVDAQTKESSEYFAKIIFVNASAINSAYILLNSTSDRFPNGLGNESGELGHNLMDHHSRVGASGVMEGFEDKYYYGQRANGIYIPRFRNVGSDKRDYLRGFGYQGGASRQGWARGVAEMSFGADFKEQLTKPGPWTMGLSSFGEHLPDHRNYVYLDKSKKDPYGLPMLVIDCEYRDNEKKMRIDMMNDAAEMLEAAGLKDVKGYDRGGVPGQSKHEMGTARMGTSSKNSVLNKNNQVWGCENVFVTDGAAMASSSCVNPSLTYMALTARAVDFAVKELNKQNI
ncbi:GMC family oxidoreductase [Xanthocytophaga agilis]|uniref:GMC family oxidoreductase n=1 Tax=Xanthocytophaga agilis TaxID=3048010 RepID=A0AAE3RCJ7_9BACT|nr:GMC family oxidoreductase [Xanthocytophaga agilis]MDJ1505977.1 GMC family oxidoreductase [Xanthocytophaga agilis]